MAKMRSLTVSSKQRGEDSQNKPSFLNQKHNSLVTSQVSSYNGDKPHSAYQKHRTEIQHIIPQWDTGTQKRRGTCPASSQASLYKDERIPLPGHFSRYLSCLPVFRSILKPFLSWVPQPETLQEGEVSLMQQALLRQEGKIKASPSHPLTRKVHIFTKPFSD